MNRKQLSMHLRLYKHIYYNLIVHVVVLVYLKISMSAVVQLRLATPMPIVKILGALTLVPVKLDLLVIGNHALVRVYTLS